MVVSSFIAPVTDLHSVVASLVYNNGLFGNFAPGQVYSHNLCSKPSVVILAVVKSRSNFILFCPDDQIFPKKLQSYQTPFDKQMILGIITTSKTIQYLWKTISRVPCKGKGKADE